MAMAALAGLSVALLFLWMPVGLVEMLVASSGLSEAVPAAAPPLGLKARLMMAGFAGLMAVGVVGLTRRDSGVPALEDQEGRAKRAQGARKMGFAFSKLTALARGRAAPEPDMPVLRRADAHPDAPSRPPIFASRDFDGLDIFPRTEAGRRPLVTQREPERDTVVPLGNLAMPSAPMPLAQDQLPQPAFLRPAGPFAAPTLVQDESADEMEDEAVVEDVVAEDIVADIPEPVWTPPVTAPISPAMAMPTPAPLSAPEPGVEPVRPAPLPTHGLSITELTDRLERGLAHRSRKMSAPAGTIADMPVAPAVPVRDSVEQDQDEALRAALGALRSMASRR